ncbi:hypothetical protein ACFV80_35350, partial [Streptomyces sp. NPDC059862]|uniref:hypothetical protein n=1 Tax=Streptomyces sp. NPDC059862 TaxID=3346975 RepID=UPI00365D2BE0
SSTLSPTTSPESPPPPIASNRLSLEISGASHYRPKTRHHPARSGWFVAIPVHIAGIIERGHIASNTDDRLLPQRTLLVQ